MTVHWAETAEEVEWMAHGEGAFAGLVQRSPRRPGLDLIEHGGLLNERLSLVHGNLPQPGEVERLARAGCTLVHCPGSHAYFDRAPFPLADYLGAGVPIALGTDSEASNERLDMRREMALMRSAFPSLEAGAVWAMATTTAARVLGGDPREGTLLPGAPADLVEFQLQARSARDCLEALTLDQPAVSRVWVAGEPCFGGGDGDGPQK